MPDFNLLPPRLANLNIGHIPHLADYFGVWSIHEPVFRSAVERINKLDLATHVRSEKAHDDAKSQADGDYDVTADGIAIFQVSGPMMKSVSSLSGGTSTVYLRSQIRSARKSNNVVAGMLVMDTPGGTVKGNRDLADEVAAFAASKPIFAFIDDLCASAGVSVASQATKRFANNPTALFGAMGTYSVLVDAKQAAEKAGFLVHVIKAGDYKGMGEPGTEITEEQLAEAQRIVNALNDEYVEIIARGLDMPVAKVKQMADGRIHPAEQAQQMGLIDGIQSYEQTYRQLVAAAGKSSKPKSTQRSATMPQETQTPQPASLAELKAKFPKSTADWREKQLEAGATLADAAIDFANDQAKRADELQKQLDDSDKTGARRSAKQGSLGHDPLLERGKTRKAAKKDDGDDDMDEDDMENDRSELIGDPVADFNSAVRKIAGRNADLQRRQGAIRQVIARDPELYQAYLLATNPGRRQARMIAEKLGAAD